MPLGNIVTALEDLLTEELPTINVMIPFPEQPPESDALPALFGEVSDILIQESNLSMWMYRVELYYLHAERSGNIGGQFLEIYPVPRQIVVALHTSATLGGLLAGPPTYETPSVEFGTSPWRDKSYTGFMMPIILKEKFADPFTV